MREDDVHSSPFHIVYIMRLLRVCAVPYACMCPSGCLGCVLYRMHACVHEVAYCVCVTVCMHACMRLPSVCAVPYACMCA